MMDDNTLYIVILFTVVYCLMYIADVFKYRALADTIAPIVDSMRSTVDAALAPFGDELKPANDIFTAALTLMDEDTDALVQALPDGVIKKLQGVLSDAQKLTDGEVDAAS